MKQLVMFLFIINSIIAFGQNRPIQMHNTDLHNNIVHIENEILIHQKLIDSLRVQLQSVNKTVEKADKLYTYSEEIYNKSKDSISITNWLIGLFLSIIALIATIIGWNVYQSRRDIKSSIEKLKGDAENQINQLSIISQEQITNASQTLAKKNVKAISILNKQNEQLFSQKTKDLMDFAERKIVEISESNVELIKDMVSKHTKEQFLLQKSKILIINKQDTSAENGLEMILKRFKSTVETIETLDFSNIELEKIIEYDAVIMDNINYEDESKNWNFGNDYFDELIKIVTTTCQKNNAFLFFGRNDGGLIQKLPHYAHLINFANQSATLFANLIDLLDYRLILKSE